VTIGALSTAPLNGGHPMPIMTSVQTNTMTKQQTLQAARNVITGKRATSLADVTRNDLKAGARAMGRTAEQVSKASTLRLAFWASVGASAI